jgi:hypothetical protein
MDEMVFCNRLCTPVHRLLRRTLVRSEQSGTGMSGMDGMSGITGRKFIIL